MKIKKKIYKNKCFSHGLLFGELPCGNYPSSSEMETWNDETKNWEGFSGDRWCLLLFELKGKNREDVVSKIKEINNPRNLLIFTRVNSLRETNDECSLIIGFLRRKKGALKDFFEPNSTLQNILFEFTKL